MSTIMNHIPPLERDIELAKEEIWRMDRDEIVRLALLGIWARDKAIPALELSKVAIEAMVTTQTEVGMGIMGSCIVAPETISRIKEALEALPEEGK